MRRPRCRLPVCTLASTVSTTPGTGVGAGGQVAGSDSVDGKEADQIIVERVNSEPFALDPMCAAYGHGARAGGDPELT